MNEVMEKQVGGEHYKTHLIQPWDIIDVYKLNFYEGNALKYLLRRKGNRLEDLEKCKHYIEKEIVNIQTWAKDESMKDYIEECFDDDEEEINTPQCRTCGNYINDEFNSPNCQGCSQNPFYINCFTLGYPKEIINESSTAPTEGIEADAEETEETQDGVTLGRAEEWKDKSVSACSEELQRSIDSYSKECFTRCHPSSFAHECESDNNELPRCKETIGIKTIRFGGSG